MATEQSRQVVVVAPTKSTGVAILLTVLVRPLGNALFDRHRSNCDAYRHLGVRSSDVWFWRAADVAHLHHMGRRWPRVRTTRI